MVRRNFAEEFNECEKELDSIDNLEELFKVWKKAQDIEIDEIESMIFEELSQDGKRDERDIFEHDFYKMARKGHKNTISSQFVQFFSCPDDCPKRTKTKIEERLWIHVLKNAFNMDGCVGTFDINNEGYKYIFLLKEANDSKKVCMDDYPPFKLDKDRVNVWLQNWRKGGARMLNNLHVAMNKVLKEETGEMSKEEFLNTIAYMNVNKRGGTLQTAGYDTKAVINYAEKYRKFILKEICLLSGKNQKVTVFVAGKSKDYFPPLMNVLNASEVKNPYQYKYEYENENCRKTIQFINITHPSKPGITGAALEKDMKDNSNE